MSAAFVVLLFSSALVHAYYDDDHLDNSGDSGASDDFPGKNRWFKPLYQVRVMICSDTDLDDASFAGCG